MAEDGESATHEGTGHWGTGTDGGDPTDSGWCGACGNVVDATQETCTFCGRALTGEVADRLRVIVRRRHELETQSATLRREVRTLDDERFGLMRATMPPSPPRARSGATERGLVGEWRPEVVSNVLVWLGAALLALAALTFVAVAFTRLSSTGRTVLMACSALVPFTIALLLRRRLPHTADAVFVLSVVFAGIAAATGRHASGAPHVSGLAWLAVASGVGAVVTGLIGRWIGFASACATAAIGVVVCAASTAYTIQGSHARLGASFAVAAVLLVLLAAHAWRTQLWRRSPHYLLTAGALLMELIACGFALRSTLGDHRHDLAAAVAVALLGVPPLVARVRRADFPLVRTGRVLVAVSTAALTLALVVLVSGVAHGDALAVLVSLMGTVIVVTSIRRDGDIALPIAGVGGVYVGAALIAVAAPVLAVFRPLSWSLQAWTEPAALQFRDHLAPEGQALVLEHGMLPAVAVLLAGIATLACAASRRQSQTSEPDVIGAALIGMAIAYALVASGASAALVAAVSLVVAGGGVAVSVVAQRRGATRLVPAGIAAALFALVPAVAASIAVRSVAVGATATVAAGLAVAAIVTTPSVLRRVCIVGAAASGFTSAGTTASAFGADRATAGLVVAVLASVMVAAAALWRDGGEDHVVASVTAHLAVGAGLLLAADHIAMVAIGLTVLAAAHAIGAIRWAPYRVAGAVSAVAATWAWLAAANVRLPEAYTLPAAAVMLGAGFIVMRGDTEYSSWELFGPGLFVAFAPTLALVIQDTEAVRAVPLTVAALIVVIIGARARAQAPIVLGAGTLIALGLDILGPVAARGPRWVALGIAGVALLWLGATAERRLVQARVWSQHFGAYR